ncbi:proline-rich receptor-like protein kinase PERK4 [Aegilops tauschii subsp. strangulata]|uniref:non-specific serine/threonine protein kinase n=1 Tax=Aegilops tauschii subsp. strangulata TaxID=200361 RepID=A0A453LXQ4_AEGTS|nr:proline-rich receptor-like protein kinase PERK4 [Aegilops tauschii subsp. strangulata]
MSSNSSSAAPPPPSNSSPPPSAAPPPSPSTSNSSSPAPSSSNDPSPPPAPPKSHAAPTSPARVPSPPAQSSRGSGDSSRSSQASAHRVSPNTTAEIIFAAAGAAMLLALLIAACVCCSRRTAPRRRRKPHNPMHFYADTSGNKASSTYYTGGPQPQWQSGTGAGPSTSTSGPPGAAWPLPPDMNSGVYSSPRDQPTSPPAPHETLGLGRGTFTYEELAAATGGFSQANLLGQGGFGYVHKGVLPSGRAVAVKQLKSGSGQGEREFQAEVDIIGRVHHRHLVSLVGHCIAGASRMLVYEFVPNKTLEFHLHGEGLPAMAWPTRLRIALGAAKGLAYLHEDCHPRIIHRDIKSANILLDNNFEAMVADFGLAKLTYDGITHVSTRVMGTFGYLAPEYASSGKLTEKSDVYSYGVMLVELLTGRRPIDATAHLVLEDGLVEWARPALSRALADGDYGAVADPRLQGSYDPVEMARVVASAAACVRHSAKKRPKMSQIVRALEGDMSLEDLNDGVRPGQSRLFGEEAGSYSSDMNRTKEVAVASPEYSGRFGRPSPVSSDRPNSEETSPVERQPPHL